jgi:transposase
VPMFAGVDWGGARHQLAIVDDVGSVVLNERFTHDRGGLDDLLDSLRRTAGEQAPVAIERSEGLLVEALQANEHPVFPVSPRVSARARERYQATARKDDRFDAFVLADTLRHEHHRWRALAVPSPVLAELRVLVRDRRRTLETQQAVEAQLRAALEAYHPAAARLFSSVDRAITLAFVRDYPTPQAALRLGQCRMQAFLDRHGYTGRVPAELLVERLRTNLLSATPGSIEGHRFSALALVDHLELLNYQLKAFDVRCAAVFDQHPDATIFASFPGAGPVISAGLLAEIGEDRRRFPTVEVLLAEAGLAPVTLASGKVTRVRFRRACNTRLRDNFNWWAYTLKRIDEPSRVAYLAALDRGQHSHRALRGIGSRWARILWRCWQDGVAFDRSRRATA